MKQFDTKQTAAIFDRWFFRMGGGERMVISMLTALRDAGYKTSLLTTVYADLQLAQKTFGVDLRDIEVVILPDEPDTHLSEWTRPYDIFVNASFLDFIPSKARKSFLVTYFPTPYPGMGGKLKQILIQTLQNWFIYPNKFIGFGAHNTIETQSIVTCNRNSLRQLSLTLHFDQMAFSVLDRIVFRQGATIVRPKKTIDVRKNTCRYDFDNLTSMRDTGITIVLPDSAYAKNIQVFAIRILDLRFWLYNFFASVFPRFEARLHGGESSIKAKALPTYTKIFAISAFVQQWISTYWGQESVLLYPALETKAFRGTAEKKQWITNVGRFFTGAHTKHQLELIRAFIRLFDQGHTDWELHLIGSVGKDSQHQEYLEMVQNQANGYPIHFHLNVPQKEVVQVLAQTTLYWHATGFGSDTDPLTAEHFGISVVEAMASGAVPLVYSIGGPAEIVTKQSGDTYTRLDELVAKTSRLINNQDELALMQKHARARAADFDESSFRERFLLYVQE